MHMHAHTVSYTTYTDRYIINTCTCMPVHTCIQKSTCGKSTVAASGELLDRDPDSDRIAESESYSALHMIAESYTGSLSLEAFKLPVNLKT